MAIDQDQLFRARAARYSSLEDSARPRTLDDVLNDITSEQAALASNKAPARTVFGIGEKGGGVVGDVGTTALRAAIGIPQAAVGLADLVSGGRAGKFLDEKVGFSPTKAQQVLREQYSPAQDFGQRQVEQADGFIPTLQAYVAAPAVAAQHIAESLPSAYLGGAAAKGLLGLGRYAPTLSKAAGSALGRLGVTAETAAAAAGEGLVSAGQTAAQMRETSPDKLLTGKQQAAALVSGVLTSGISGLGGKLSGKVGLSDFDTMIAGGAAADVAGNKFANAAAGAAIEGIEEALQSSQEQILQNIAEGKDWRAGIGKAAAGGIVLGGAMGAKANFRGAAADAAPEGAAPVNERLAREREAVAELGGKNLTDIELRRLQGNPDALGEIGARRETLDEIAANREFTARQAEDVLAAGLPEDSFRRQDAEATLAQAVERGYIPEADRFAIESTATNKRAAGIPLTEQERNAVMQAEQRLTAQARPAADRPPTQTAQQPRKKGIADETADQAAIAFDAYQPAPPAAAPVKIPAPESDAARAADEAAAAAALEASDEFAAASAVAEGATVEAATDETFTSDAAEYNRLSNIPAKPPELPIELRDIKSLNRKQLFEAAQKHGLRTGGDQTLKSIKADLGRVAAEKQNVRLRTPEEQTRLDQLSGRTPERLAAQAALERSAAEQRRFQQAAAELDNAPLKPAPGAEMRLIRDIEQARSDRAAAIQRIVRPPAQEATESAIAFELQPPSERMLDAEMEVAEKTEAEIRKDGPARYAEIRPDEVEPRSFARETRKYLSRANLPTSKGEQYRRISLIPTKIPDELRAPSKLNRVEVKSVIERMFIPVKKGASLAEMRSAIKNFASTYRVRTPEQQAFLDDVDARELRERPAAKTPAQIEAERAAAEYENLPLNPAPGGEAYFAGVENISAEREAQGEFASREGEDVAAALPVMMRELSRGTAGRRLRNAGESYGYDADAGAMIGDPSSYPKWVQEDLELSKAGRKTIERVAELTRTGGKMTERQIDLWSRLKAAAQKEYNRNPEIQQGVEYDRLAADGYNFEAVDGGLLASDLSEGDSVALTEDGAIVRYTSQGVDENTGRVVLEKDGGGTKELGGFDLAEPVAVKLARSEVPFSKAQATLENAADVRAELAKEYSAGWIDRAERRGLLKLVDPAAAERLVVEMGIDPKRAADGRIEGFVSPDGQIYFVQGGIEAGQVLGVAAHEIGEHAMRSGFTKEKDWLDVLDHSDRLLAKGDESVVEARRRAVKAGAPDSLLREETVAYLNNVAPKHGIIRNLIAKLKQFMVNKGLASKFFISKLTVADLQALAQGATKAAIKGKAAPEWAKSVDARLSAKITTDLRVETQNKKGETVTRPLTKKALAGQKPLTPVKEAVERRVAELRTGLTEGDVLARKIEEAAQKKVNPRKQAQAEKDLLEQVRVFRKQHLQPEIQGMANEIFGVIDPEARRMTPAKEANLKATRAEIERLKAEGADIDPALEAKVARLDRRRIGDMLPGEVQALLDVANELAYVNKTKNKLLAVERGQDAAELSKGIVAPIEAKPSKRYTEAKKAGQKAERGKNPILDLGRQLLGDPASTFKTLMLDLGRANEKSSAAKLAQTVAERQNVELKHRKELDEQLAKSIGNWQALAESKAWNAEKEYTLLGKKFTLTPGEAIYLKYSLNDQNVSDSIEKMGYRKKLDTKATKMSRAEREAIKLNPEEQRVYDALADYFESTYQVLNPAHVEMKGWTLPAAGHGKYLPKSVSNLTLADELGSIIRSGSVENTGVVQDRIGTLNEINLKDIFEVITRQRDIASKYAAYAPMVRDFNLVFRSPELKNTMQMEYGLEKNGKSIVENYVDDLLRDLQGNKPQSDSGVEAAVRKVRTNAAGALLAFRLTTPLMQMTGYPRALAHISPQNLAKAMRMRGGFEEAAEWNMRAYARRDVGIDREISDNRNKRLIRVGMAGIQKMDELVTGRLWSATKLQTAQETGLRGDELLKETSKRFDAVLDTQGGHTMADLSMTSRTQSELAKMFTIFSSDKFAMLNEIKRGLIIREHTGDWKPLARASAGMVLSAAMAAGVATVVGGAVSGRDKDYEKEFAKNLAGSLPLFDQLVSMFQGFNPSSAGIEAIGDAANAAGRIASLARKQASGETVTAEQYSKALQSVVYFSSQATGVPTKNIADNLGFAKRLALGEDALERVESELRDFEDYDFEKRKRKVTKGKQGAELRAALSKLRKEFADLDQGKVAAARRLSAAKKRIKEIDKELEGKVPAALGSRREGLREEIAARAVR